MRRRTTDHFRALVFNMHFLDVKKEFHHQQGSKMREGVKVYPENTAYFFNKIFLTTRQRVNTLM